MEYSLTKFFELFPLSNKFFFFTQFRKMLIKSGFLMMQESVYSKLALNTTVSGAIVNNIKKNKPKTGLVQILVITEKQFSKMEFVRINFLNYFLSITSSR